MFARIGLSAGCYLGNKGYTIPKAALTKEQWQQVLDKLTVTPRTMSIGNTVTTSYPVFRESGSKFYVPHYFGLKEFGPYSACRVTPGEDIEVPFAGSLRPYQEPVVQKYLDHVRQAHAGCGGGLLELPCAYGKTVLSIYLISQLRKKTIVIVHKEFLMNQWIERIQQFLPTARIGKIQGPVVDIEDKDIVLCMLQSLSMKEYPQSLFDSFGFTIVDEVHHISSEVFSNALFKLVTQYMLGLSATMNRKDGTTHVIKMFLGPVIFKGERDEKHAVTVRKLQYKVADPEFNRELTDFRGNPAYSSMISKLCEYNRRSDFLVQVVAQLFRENPRQQLMILAHNRNLLTYLHDAIAHRQIASVGYYLGGMKETALKETETKQVVIATYAMASEALDIKSLTTLLMATPKTDIEQSVGRILREKHSQPMVVDIVDSHEVFQNQWKKRQTFYKRQQYAIVTATSTAFLADPEGCWTAVSAPAAKRGCKLPSSSSEEEEEVEEEETQAKKHKLDGGDQCLLKQFFKPT